MDIPKIKKDENKTDDKEGKNNESFFVCDAMKRIPGLLESKTVVWDGEKPVVLEQPKDLRTSIPDDETAHLTRSVPLGKAQKLKSNRGAFNSPNFHGKAWSIPDPDILFGRKMGTKENRTPKRKSTFGVVMENMQPMRDFSKHTRMDQTITKPKLNNCDLLSESYKELYQKYCPKQPMLPQKYPPNHETVKTNSNDTLATYFQSNTVDEIASLCSNKVIESQDLSVGQTLDILPAKLNANKSTYAPSSKSSPASTVQLNNAGNHETENKSPGTDCQQAFVISPVLMDDIKYKALESKEIAGIPPDHGNNEVLLTYNPNSAVSNSQPCENAYMGQANGISRLNNTFMSSNYGTHGHQAFKESSELSPSLGAVNISNNSTWIGPHLLSTSPDPSEMLNDFLEPAQNEYENDSPILTGNMAYGEHGPLPNSTSVFMSTPCDPENNLSRKLFAPALSPITRCNISKYKEASNASNETTDVTATHQSSYGSYRKHTGPSDRKKDQHTGNPLPRFLGQIENNSLNHRASYAGLYSFSYETRTVEVDIVSPRKQKLSKPKLLVDKCIQTEFKGCHCFYPEL